MKTEVEVTDRKEAAAVRQALRDPAIRAFVVVAGILSTLPSDRAKARVLNFVRDCYVDDRP